MSWENESFYLTLPSDSPSETFASTNTPARFITPLSQKMNLRNFEVGLASVTWKHTWNNVKEAYATVTLRNRGTRNYKVEIPDGRYETIWLVLEKLVAALNTFVIDRVHNEKLSDIVHFFYEPLNDHTYIITRQPFASVTLSKNLAHILGFHFDGREYGHASTGSIKSPFTADIFGGFLSMYIYSDLVRPWRVGSGTLPLLRSVDVTDSKKNSMQFREFNNIHYVPTVDNEVSNVSVIFAQDNGNDVGFVGGKTQITLHFRPKQK